MKISNQIAIFSLISTLSLSANSSIKDAINDTKVDTTLYFYTQSKSMKNTKSFAYGNLQANLGLESGNYYGFNLGLEAKGNAKVFERYKKDYINNAPFENEALLSQSYLKYKNEYFDFHIGRIKSNAEWFIYNYEGVEAKIVPSESSSVNFGFIRKKSETSYERSQDFFKPTDDGIYYFEVDNRPTDNLQLKSYIYTAPKAITFYGLKTNYNFDKTNLLLHYASSSISSKYEQDMGRNSILHTDIEYSFTDEIVASLGYIQTGKKGGILLMSAYGDNSVPFYDANESYGKDARTYYAQLLYAKDEYSIRALYGMEKYKPNNKTLQEKELNLEAIYNFTNNFNAIAVWINVRAEDSSDYGNYNKFLTKFEYKF